MIARHLVPLAVLVMLTFVSPVSAQNSVLTPELLSFLLQLAAHSETKTVDDVVSPAIANVLGLSPTGQGWPSRQVSIPENRDGPSTVVHGFAVGLGEDRDVLFVRRVARLDVVFRVHRGGTLDIEVIFDPQNRSADLLNPTDAMNEFNAELAWWEAIFKKTK